jgi:ClpP class serine protease
MPRPRKNSQPVTVTDIPEPEEILEATPKEVVEQSQAGTPSWFDFLRDAQWTSLYALLPRAAEVIFGQFPELSERYAIVALYDSSGVISSFETDRIFAALSKLNPQKEKDILMILLSNGGSIEPAYQLSKLCRQYAADRFVVVVPRQAKSAATLIAIGADEIHMGPLSQLGPIDPQLGGLPALGVLQALKTIASLAQDYPGSGDLLSRYLRMALTVEQIGYCERIGESAVQYAERLLATKPSLTERASKIARELVYEYKDHGFVIDQEEARERLGSDWIKTGTQELDLAERLYRMLEEIELGLNAFHKRRLLLIGDARSDFLIFDRS